MPNGVLMLSAEIRAFKSVTLEPDPGNAGVGILKVAIIKCQQEKFLLAFFAAIFYERCFEMTQAKEEETKRLALSGIMLAMSVVLSFIKVFEWPFGGSITACSMLPVALLGYTYGVKWGLLCGTVHGILQAITGAAMSSAFAGMNAGSALAIIIIDYLFAFSAVGLSGMLKGKIKNHTAAFAIGTALAVFIRYIAHVISGFIFYRSYADWFFGEIMVNDFTAKLMQKCSPNMLGLIYSVIYNGAYMLPELILTSIAAALVISLIKPVRNEMLKTHIKKQ